jgi:tetratricopeptide (TPR) repeat protein
MAENSEQAGDYDAAERLLREAVDAALELGAQGNLAGFLESLAGVYFEQHRVEQAIRVLAATDAYRSDRGIPLYPAEQHGIELIITRARTEAGPIRFGLAWASGRALTLTKVVREVLHLGLDGSQNPSAADQPIQPPTGQPAESALSAAPW